MGMRKSQIYSSEGLVEKKRKSDVHPIWRGVGVFLIVLIPIIGYLGSLMVIESNRSDPWLPIPAQVIVPGPDPLILLKIILTIIIGSFVYFVLMMITFIIFRLLGPSRSGPHDVPPIR